MLNNSQQKNNKSKRSNVFEGQWYCHYFWCHTRSGGLWGWRYYDGLEITAKETASAAYNDMIQTLASDDRVAATQDFIANNNDTAMLHWLIYWRAATVEADDYAKAADAAAIMVSTADTTLQTLHVCAKLVFSCN